MLALEGAAFRIDGAAILQYVNEAQVVALADHEVIGVMCRGDLDSTSTFWVHAAGEGQESEGMRALRLV